jgi:hypothetical protein
LVTKADGKASRIDSASSLGTSSIGFNHCSNTRGPADSRSEARTRAQARACSLAMPDCLFVTHISPIGKAPVLAGPRVKKCQHPPLGDHESPSPSSLVM